jgi:glycosyltransferase involved in cell wall biosynthesis
VADIKTQRISAPDTPTGISVVTPTHGRGSLVRALLESLQIARFATSMPSEVLIIDSSKDNEGNDIRTACDQFGASYMHHPINNVRQKRNLGIQAAQFPIILFVDSDCRALPGLIVEHVAAYGDGTGGVIGLTRFVGPDTWVWRLIERTSVLDAFAYAKRMEVAPWGPTCNISYRKQVLDEIGQFDTSFPFRLGGDDVDLGLRVTDSGYRIKCNPQAVVEHTRETWSKVGLIARRLFRWGRMHFHMMRKHTGRIIYDFPTVSGIFFLLLILMAISALATRHAALILAPFIWLVMELLIETALLCRSSEQNWRAFPYSLGAKLLGSIFETGTLVEGLRHGSVMPFYKEIYYTQPSPNSPGRNRRIIQIWASTLALIILTVLSYWL